MKLPNLIFAPKVAGRYATASYRYTLYPDDNAIGFVFRGVAMSVNSDDYIYRNTLTGWYFAKTGGTYMWQTTDGSYLASDDDDFLVFDEYNPDYSNAQDIVNKIIKNNKRILENNLICARYASKLTEEQRTLLYNLQYRLDNRNQALLNKQLITSATESYPQGYANEASYLEQFMKNDGKVGVVVSSTAIIVVSAVVTVSLGAAAYFAYMAYYNESMEDVKYSDELTATLASKLTAEEFKQLKEETAGIVTKARITSSLGTFGNLFKYAAFGVAGYFLYKLIAPKVKEYKSKNQK